MYQLPLMTQLGDDALLVTFADAMSWDVGVKVQAAARRIREVQLHDSRLESVTDVVPAYTTLAVYFDSARVSLESMAAAILPIATAADDAMRPDASALVEIPVTYNGPDLAEVAGSAGLTVEEVIARHSGRTYRAYMSGFAPGFTYLGDLDDALVLPRRTVPRIRIRPGSVAIAGSQTAVYPLETPGGWHLIGTTTAVMFDAERNPPALVQAGDTVRFVKVENAE
jgi:KipI family sensor histidine kinase inhibitor